MALTVAPADVENVPGVYTITRRETGQSYVGSTRRLRKRWQVHRSLLRAGRHHSPKLQSAWDAFGEDAFEFAVVAHCADGDLIAIEQFEIDSRNAATKGFNMHPRADGPTGKDVSAETRERLSAALRGKTRRPLSDEHKRKLSAIHKGNQYCLGKKASEEAKEKMRQRVVSDERRAAISAAMKGNKHSLGFKHTEQTCAKVSAALMGNTHRQGKAFTEEAKAKMSEARKGIPKSEEHRRKIGEAVRAARAATRLEAACR